MQPSEIKMLPGDFMNCRSGHKKTDPEALFHIPFDRQFFYASKIYKRNVWQRYIKENLSPYERSTRCWAPDFTHTPRPPGFFTLHNGHFHSVTAGLSCCA